MSNDIQKLISKSKDPRLIESAFEFAQLAYKDKNRISGENVIHHAVRVAMALDKMGLDCTTVAFGILHDILDDLPNSAKDIQIVEIEKKFGKEIGRLIQRASELGKVRYSLSFNIKDKKTFTREKIENLRRMFLAIAGDLRVIIVELTSRLDGLNYLQYLPKDQQKLYSMETLRIFVPVANRLGLSEIRRSLEDISFSCLAPVKFDWVKKNVKEEYEEREKYLKKFIPQLTKIFKKERVRVLEINYRAKSYWSCYKKLLSHDMDFNKIHDLLALRIIATDVESCYKILGIIHKYFKPISEEINDYIAKPKDNGYRSLHTTIFSKQDKITEIQIKTEEMHKEAEHGVCAHWSYKEKIDLRKEGKNFEWLKDIPEFWKTFKIDFFINQVFVLTPRGDVITLPNGACPVDFAYAVHSQIGNHCESAKIDGKIVPLSHILKNGNVVEIATNKNKVPSQDWLRFVKTSLAKSSIRKFAPSESKFKFLIPGFIKNKLTEISEAAKKRKERKALLKKSSIKHIYLAGQKGMLIHIAKCCNPQSGDKVQAYLSKNRAAVLHRISCPNFKKIAEKFPEKIIDASWE
jgi:RelA/SpoT family (p)ppGpp synthetase